MEFLGGLLALIAVSGAVAVAYAIWGQPSGPKRLGAGPGPRALLGQDEDAPLRELIAKGEKVAAIRAHYAALDSGSMGDSKAYVEALAAQMAQERAQQASSDDEDAPSVENAASTSEEHEQRAGEGEPAPAQAQNEAPAAER